MWSKKWYLKRNISCDANLLNELLETDVHWDDAIVVTTGKMRKLWDSLSELHNSLCEKWLERTVLRPALLPVKTAWFTQFNWDCIGRLTVFHQEACHTGVMVRGGTHPETLNRLKPNDPYSGRTTPLTSKRCILYIYSTNTGTEYFKHGIYSPSFFSWKCSLFHNSNISGSCFIHILYSVC